MTEQPRILLSQAMSLHQRGDLGAAAALYQRILRQEPNHFHALHLLGVIACQSNRLDQGVVLISKAIALDAMVPAAHLNLARAFARLGRTADALAHYDSALGLDSTIVEAHINRGDLLRDLDKVEESLESYDRAIALEPGSVEAYNNRANALGSVGRWAEALTDYDRALALRPAFATALVNRALALVELGRPVDALASYDLAISHDASLVHAHVNRGNLLQALNRPHDALASYDLAIALAPNSALAHVRRAALLRELANPSAALASVDHSLRLQPGNADAHFVRGNALKDLNRLPEAAASYEQAIVARPDHAEAQTNRALCQLLLGQFEEGFRSYEWRKKGKNPVANKVFPGIPWLGDGDISGKTLLLFSEQGLGDTLQFCRYARLAEMQGAKVVLSVPRRLCRLLSSLSPTIRLVAEDEEPGPVDFHCPLLSLPLAFGTTLETIPAQIPYLAADGELVARWSREIGQHGFKVGICWQGTLAPVDAGRSFPVRMFETLAKIPDVRLLSLQKGYGVEQLLQLPDGMVVEDHDEEMDTGPHAFSDTAAVIENLDLVVTSDTSIAHLAGALGRPAWIALKQVPDWRWLLHGRDSPWYPTLRLFRQAEADKWEPVFEDIKSALMTLLEQRSFGVQFPGNERSR